MKVTDLTPEDIFVDNHYSNDSSYYIVQYNKTGIVIFLSIITLLLMGTVFGRVVFLNIRDNVPNESESSGLLGTNYIKPLRGSIYDRFGKLLAYNEASFELFFDPSNASPDTTILARQIQEISAIFPGIQLSIENLPQKKISLLRNIPVDKAILFESNKQAFPGFELEDTTVRLYQTGTSLSHIIGYTGKLSDNDLQEYPRYVRNDVVGKIGIEKSYESILKGEYGLYSSRKGEPPIRLPKDGQSIQITIDFELQEALESSMKRILREQGISRASGIIMNPQNGEILSMVSLPNYDNNVFSRGISQKAYEELVNNIDNPLLNRCIAGEFAPASTVKPLLIGAFLQEGIIDTNTRINDPLGRLEIENIYEPSKPFIYPDWKVHGVSDLYKSIYDSVNVFFYTYGGGIPGKINGLGITKMAEYYKAFGYGSLTGIDIPGERAGNVANPEWKKSVTGESWVLGDTYNASIGQGGMSATPLQIARAISAIANGGTLYTPHFYQGIRSNTSSELLDLWEDNAIKAIPIEKKNITIIQDAMRRTVTEGTGYQLQSLPFEVSAKTGTAQTGKEKNNSFFVSYAPSDNPELTMVILIEEGDEGYLSSIPVAKEVYEWYYQNRMIK